MPVVRDDGTFATGAQSIGRAALLMRLVAACRSNGGSLSEIVAQARLSKPTVRRMLLALIENGLVEQDPITRRYFLGPEAYVLGTVAAERFGIHRLALENVRRLALETGDAAFIQIRRDWSVVCLHREDGDYPIRSHVLSSGDRHPLGAGAAGIALLAALSDEEMETCLHANADLLASRYPVLNPRLLKELVAEARDKGYGINRGLLFPGSWGIGVVVRDRQGRPDACLSIAAIESRLQPDREGELARLLFEEARRLEARLRDFGQSADERSGTVGAARRRGRREEIDA